MPVPGITKADKQALLTAGTLDPGTFNLTRTSWEIETQTRPRSPRATTPARWLLCSSDAFGVLHGQGIDAFHAIYGDCYISGYRIGGDTSVLFSTNASSRSESETKINIDTESWFGDYHERSSTTLSDTEDSTVVHISAYATIE